MHPGEIMSSVRILQLLFLFLFFLLPCLSIAGPNGVSLGHGEDSENYPSDFNEVSVVGAIGDATSRAGKEQIVAIKLAMEHFYGDASGGPALLVKNSKGDPVRAVSAAHTLIKKHRVRSIIGLEKLQEAEFVAELGNKSRVPIVSLAHEAPYWASLHWPFLVNAARSQFAQMKAIAAMVRSWRWRKVNVIYEDTHATSTGINPYLITALQEVNSEISDLLPLPPVLPSSLLSEKLMNLKNGQCRVFIVHATMPLATSIFMEAKKLGMMEKEFVWITTTAITDQSRTLNASSISTMQGVLGVKTYFTKTSKKYKDFRSSFRDRFHKQYPREKCREPGIHALQAYDAMWAMALAMDSPGSWSGQQLLSRILVSNFQGLTGKFKFIEGILDPAGIFQIVNIVGKSDRELGFWSEELGFSRSVEDGTTYNKSMIILGQVFWPGGPLSIPRGWAPPTRAKRLQIGVPAGGSHPEFVNLSYAYPGAPPNVTGFSIDVFEATVALLPYNFPPYDFVPYDGSYDSLVRQVDLVQFDAVVGDTAIVANRCEYVEFSQPYSASGLQMVIYSKPKKLDRAWLIKQPFTTVMWAFTGIINVYNGFVVWLIERDHHPEFRGSVPNQIGTMLSLAFTTLFSLQGAKLHSNLSRMTLVVWLFMATIITQSFMACLTTLLTVERLEVEQVDIETLKKNGAKVGCDGNSFVLKYLELALHFPQENIVPIFSEERYAEALMRGEIAAAFLEVPYVKVFLAKYCRGFTTSGQPYKVGGFGFVFPRSSPYLPDISKAIVEVAETGTLQKLEAALTSSYKCPDSDQSDGDRNSLGLSSFLVLFVMSGGTSSVAFALFLFRRARAKWHCQCDVPRTQQQQCLEELQQHNPHADEHWLFAWEMENQGRWP